MVAKFFQHLDIKKLPIALATSLLVSGVTIGLRSQGVFEKIELWAYDYLIRATAKSQPNPRILLVAVDDTALKKLNSDKVSDRALQQTLETLMAYKPRVIGIDILRDVPIGEGRKELINYSNRIYEPLEGKIKPIVYTCALPSPSRQEGIDPPPVIDGNSAIGFANLEADTAGEIMRRAPISSIPADIPEAAVGNTQETPKTNCYAPFSLSFLTALSYLQGENIAVDTEQIDRGTIKVNNFDFTSLAKRAGAYQNLDTEAYQIILDYSSRQPAQIISLAKVLDKEITPEQIEDKIVLIGYTTKEDIHQTPFGSKPGVLVHAWAIDRIIANVLDERSPVWYWAEPAEWLWIFAWGLTGGAIAWGLKPSWQIYTAKGLGVGTIFTTSWWLFLGRGWIPLFPPVLSLVAGGIASKIVLSRLSKTLPATATSSPNSSPKEVEPTSLSEIPPTVASDSYAVRSPSPDILETRPSFDPANPPQPIINPEEPLAGQILGDRYRLEKMLGKGGMSKVYLAFDTKLAERAVAIKIMTRYSASMNASLVKRFMREVKVISRVKSSHVVQVTDFGVTPDQYPFDGSPFYVMEYFNGRTLSELLQEVGTLSPKAAIKLILQICSGLKEAHQHGIIHRDLKPDNIFLVAGGAFGEEAKILDFGIAKIVSTDGENEGQTSATQAGSFIGTYRYASPEQCRGLPDIDLRTDIYSLGVMFYEILSGHSPYNFDAQQTTHADWLVSHIRVEPKPLSDRENCQQIPQKLEAAVMKCLRKLPEERFKDLEELELALKQAMPDLF